MSTSPRGKATGCHILRGDLRHDDLIGFRERERVKKKRVQNLNMKPWTKQENDSGVPSLSAQLYSRNDVMYQCKRISQAHEVIPTDSSTAARISARVQMKRRRSSVASDGDGSRMTSAVSAAERRLTFAWTTCMTEDKTEIRAKKGEPISCELSHFDLVAE
ncbi:hypothetical protein Baya_14476 [Bagarius yarrelli]|uniref:Uncharacterized protein n=1 Tax=Bagarius yarrelli TaxID=175774 RepID=A0A556V8M9_BAGYA|nr:hypothetical protein Baya_14476 [Bagarius yarrelli]